MWLDLFYNSDIIKANNLKEDLTWFIEQLAALYFFSQVKYI